MVSLLEQLADWVVLGDGGYLIELERRMYVRGDYWVPEVVLDHPEAVEALHREFIRAGSEAIQALTFWTTRNIVDEQAGRGDQTEEINRQVVRIARSAASDGVLVAGTLAATTLMGSRDKSRALRGEEADSMLQRARSVLAEQARWLVDEGVDFLIAETFDRLDEAVAAVEEAKQLEMPVIATMSWREVDSSSTDGFSAGHCARRLKEAGADVVGFNCRQEPENIVKVLVEIREAIDGPIAVQPWGLRSLGQAGLEIRPGLLGQNEVDPDISERIQICRAEWREFAANARNLGVSYLGACCGAGPSAIRGMAEGLGRPTWETDKS
jgi:betaine-homocysteine S-methyltransferase